MEKIRAEKEIEYIPYWEIDNTSRDMLSEKGGEHYYTPMSKAKHLYILQDIKRITSKLGLKLKWPPSPENQHWEIPHLAYLYARREGKGELFFRKVHESRWLLGENICEAETIARIARACDLNETQTVNAYQNDDIRRESLEALIKAYEDGVFGIPFFVHGYNKFWGIDRFELFLRSLREENSEIKQEAGSFLPYYETDHPGGCG